MIREIMGKYRRKYIRSIQKVFITIFLFILYTVGFGITLILVMIFNRGLLKIENKGKETFWKNAEGYRADINECMRQS